MTNWQFNKDMIQILKHMIGMRFLSYEKDGVTDGQSYCVLRLNLDGKSILLKNEDEEIAMLSDDNIREEAARFSCSEIDPDEPFVGLVDDVKTIKYETNEIVKNVQIITDVITGSHKDMNIMIDMAIVIKTETHTYIFSKSETWFDEMIYINTDKDFDKICPIQKVIDMWNNDGKLEVEVNRTIMNL